MDGEILREEEKQNKSNKSFEEWFSSKFKTKTILTISVALFLSNMYAAVSITSIKHDEIALGTVGFLASFAFAYIASMNIYYYLQRAYIDAYHDSYSSMIDLLYKIVLQQMYSNNSNNFNNSNTDLHIKDSNTKNQDAGQTKK